MVVCDQQGSSLSGSMLVIPYCAGRGIHSHTYDTVNPLVSTTPNPKISCFSSCLAVIFPQSIEARS